MTDTTVLLVDDEEDFVAVVAERLAASAPIVAWRKRTSEIAPD